ncbi:response regulator, partial [Frankia nepalensis]|uniref:response regulator n=1 Tax=Frankia nepalensis TaxID=1836974 RepID=UPI001EE438F1
MATGANSANPAPAPGIRVLLVDDQELIRAGLALVLSGEAEGESGDEPPIEIVGERSDGDEVVAAVRSLRPDIVLLDIRMARMDGIDAMRALARQGGYPPVLVLTTFSDDDALWGVIAAGAAGFILKDRPADDIIAAIRLVAAGGTWLAPSARGRLLA